MRKNFLVCGLAAVMLTAASGSVQAQTVAVGPYYATPSWDQTLACATLATCPRFVVLSNMNSDAVLDRETGLVWERTVNTSLFSRAEADNKCTVVATGGRQGWRVPAAPELRSLIDPSNTSPSLPAGHPFVGVAFGLFDNYWTSTPAIDPLVPGTILAVRFSHGDMNANLGPQASANVWCVRGPANATR
jgi:Protein of unknown function (DUF1566)